MRAFVWGDAPGLRDVPEPDVGEGEALVRVVLAGICGTDLELLAGYKAFAGIPGHELVGVVERADADPRWVGRRVVAEINVACRACDRCRAGLPRHCRTRRVLGLLGRDGAFAERIAVPIENLHAVPASVADEEAVWCEPLAAALAVLDAGIEPGEPVLVLGDGRLGALVALALARRGAPVRVRGKHEAKLRRLAELGVAVETRSPAPEYGWVVDATGSPAGVDAAAAWVRPRGTIVLKSTHAGRAAVDTTRLVVDEIRLVGSRCGPFGPALALLAEGALPLRRLVDAIRPLDEAPAALAEAARPDVFKVLLRPGAA